MTIMTFRPGSFAAWILTTLDTKVGPAHPHVASDITDLTTAVDARITAARGANNGVAPLDSSGKVPAANLPSFVDDVLEYANTGAFPGTGETGKIYVATGTNKTYRWTGSTYVEISASPGSTDSVTEGSTNLYFTAARAQAAAKSYNETTLTLGVFPIFKSASVSSGNAVYHLTNDGLSTGTALFPNGPILKSLQLRAVEGSAPHIYGTPVLSNSNKTLTVPVNKSSGLFIALLNLTLLGAPAAANGSVVDMTIYGN